MLKISIKPSRRLALLLCLAHGAAAAAALLTDVSIWVKISLVLVIGASCASCLYGPALLRSGKAIVSFEIKDGRAVSFQTLRGEWHQGMLLDSSFVSPWLAILNIKMEASRFARHVVIMPDGIDADDFRQLRVWLRWRRTGVT